MNDIFTTIAKLRSAIDPDHGAVLRYGDTVLMVDRGPFGDYNAATYEMVDSPDDGIPEEDCRLAFVAESEDVFTDAGHAIEWCIGQISK